METATADYFISRDVKDEEGIIEDYGAKGYGYIVIYSGDKWDKYRFHINKFPEHQRGDIWVGRSVIFSSEGGQKFPVSLDPGKQLRPLVKSARLVK